MTSFRKGNALRAVAFTLGLFGFMGFMVLAPMANRPSVDETLELTVPWMTHVPTAEGAFSVELEQQ